MGVGGSMRTPSCTPTQIVLPHLEILPANISHMNQPKTNHDCPARLTPRSSSPNPKGSLGLEFRDELKGGQSGKQKSS